MTWTQANRDASLAKRRHRPWRIVNYGAMTEKQVIHEYLVYFAKLQTDQAKRELLWFLDEQYPKIASRVRAGVGKEWEIRAMRKP